MVDADNNVYYSRIIGIPKSIKSSCNKDVYKRQDMKRLKSVLKNLFLVFVSTGFVGVASTFLMDSSISGVNIIPASLFFDLSMVIELF